VLNVRLTFRWPMTPEERSRIHAAVARCPVHKLMTTTDIEIETTPLDPNGA
jgi:putative redox protein